MWRWYKIHVLWDDRKICKNYVLREVRDMWNIPHVRLQLNSFLINSTAVLGTEVTIVTWRARTRDRFKLLVRQTARARRPGWACTRSLGASVHRSVQAARHSTQPNSSSAALLVPTLGPVWPEDGGELWANWTPRSVSSNKVIPSAGGEANSWTKLKHNYFFQSTI